MWTKARDVPVPVPNDADFLADQDLAEAEGAAVGVGSRVDGVRETTGLEVEIAAFDANDDFVAPAGTVTFAVLERINGEKVHIADTTQTPTITLGDATAVTLSPGTYYLRITGSAGLPGSAANLRLYVKEI